MCFRGGTLRKKLFGYIPHRLFLKGITMFKNTKERTRAILFDPDNFRFVMDKPANPEVEVSVPYVFRSIYHGTNYSWKQIADFAGLRSASDALLAAHRSRPIKEMGFLNSFLVVDDVEKKVYYYDKDHKPADVITEHIGPSLTNGITTLTVSTKVPTRVLSRMTIVAPESMHLTMTITPTGGYMFDEQDNRLAIPNSSWVVSGSTRTLNDLLRTIYFIATKPGTGEIVVKVDDMSGALGGAASTAVTLTIEETKEPSIPVLTIPGEQMGLCDEFNSIDPITVTDADNKYMQIKVQPFGCAVTGFKGRLVPVTPGSFHIIYGTPENLSNELSSLEIKPYQENCSLGVELRCDLVVIREYIRITGVANDSAETVATPVAVAAEPVVEVKEPEVTEESVAEVTEPVEETKETTTVKKVVSLSVKKTETKE